MPLCTHVRRACCHALFLRRALPALCLSTAPMSTCAWVRHADAVRRCRHGRSARASRQRRAPNVHCPNTMSTVCTCLPPSISPPRGSWPWRTSWRTLTCCLRVSHHERHCRGTVRSTARSAPLEASVHKAPRVVGGASFVVVVYGRVMHAVRRYVRTATRHQDARLAHNHYAARVRFDSLDVCAERPTTQAA